MRRQADAARAAERRHGPPPWRAETRPEPFGAFHQRIFTTLITTYGAYRAGHPCGEAEL
jgi:hypothetical protein